MKKKYCWYSRIAVVISILFGVALAKNMGETSGKGVVINALCLSLLIMHIFFLVLNYKKDKAVNKALGFLKVSGDRWLGYDGFWHDGYSEIYPKREDRYFNKGGEDWGYLPSSLASWFFALFGGLLPVTQILDKTSYTTVENIVIVSLVSIINVYIIVRRTIIG